MNTLLKIISFISIALLFAACSKNASTMEITQQATNDEHLRLRAIETAAIYSFLLNEDPEGYLRDSSTLTIINETNLGADTHDDIIFRKAPSLEEETLADLRTINQQTGMVDLTLSLNKPYEVISQAEIELRNNQTSDWSDAHTVTAFSRVGFNQELDQALVYMEHYCGGECAIGTLYFLVRNKDVWEINCVITSWVS